VESLWAYIEANPDAAFVLADLAEVLVNLAPQDARLYPWLEQQGWATQDRIHLILYTIYLLQLDESRGLAFIQAYRTKNRKNRAMLISLEMALEDLEKEKRWQQRQAAKGGESSTERL
jgi:hypothetical protein